MKNKLNTVSNFVRNHKIMATISLTLVVVIAGLVENGGGKYENITVVRGDIVQKVAVTGKTKAGLDVSLAFENSGLVLSSNISVGDMVQKGQALASLDASSLLADLSKAEAVLNENIIKLEEVRRTSVDSYTNARLNLVTSIKESFVNSDNAIHNNIDQFFRNPRKPSTYVEFTFIDGNTIYDFPIEVDLEGEINRDRYSVELILENWKKMISTIDFALDITQSTKETKNNLNQISLFLNKMASATNLLVSTQQKYDATINKYKSDVSLAREAINNSISNIVSAEDKYNQAPQEIRSEIAGIGFDSVLTQESKVKQSQSEIDSIKSRLEKTVLRSPINGIVTKQDVKVGEIAPASTALISIISKDDMEIEANVSEVNIGKIKEGNSVSVIFDAYPDRNYAGKVFYIEPGETVIDGVVNYKIKVSLEENLEDLKSGLTANLKIETAQKEDVLKIPQYAITQKNGEFFVTKISNNSSAEIRVSLGIRGIDGTVEVLSGLEEGDMVRFGK
ncbi:MAG: hypothetical protein COV95_00980 [Candidatus Zambryskibacteria bacterium CG11_big_fil_rev_8_21_14_0_20_40_24]|uniref:YknX-like beta-barrel domain-containing protein n=1 Tax=Candidatus Zambryskibacteria bacterium CG11_big_fil_rev_8_21_14_0_20_40_24 TaxID=1975116 RepID=A0A2H0K713_9BACT|nr:MAG: hypothetical protein COV95_00980 [Candidatus Zambryskibacteria bacterium CG11_big_fil_rev_8_21_14_0_20_40_24]